MGLSFRAERGICLSSPARESGWIGGSWSAAAPGCVSKSENAGEGACAPLFSFVSLFVCVAEVCLPDDPVVWYLSMPMESLNLSSSPQFSKAEPGKPPECRECKQP